MEALMDSTVWDAGADARLRPAVVPVVVVVATAAAAAAVGGSTQAVRASRRQGAVASRGSSAVLAAEAGWQRSAAMMAQGTARGRQLGGVKETTACVGVGELSARGTGGWGEGGGGAAATQQLVFKFPEVMW
jgi:hypothetical protein